MIQMLLENELGLKFINEINNFQQHLQQSSLGQVSYVGTNIKVQ